MQRLPSSSGPLGRTSPCPQHGPTDLLNSDMARPIAPHRSGSGNCAGTWNLEMERAEGKDGIHVQKEWGVHRGSQDMDRALLKDRYKRW